jgi:hypothetical protein
MMLYTLDVHAEFATLYVRTLPRAPDLDIARVICKRLPTCVRVLRIRVHSVAGLDASARSDLLALVRDWRRERLGQAIIEGPTEDGDLPMARRSPQRASGGATVDAALMATFL